MLTNFRFHHIGYAVSNLQMTANQYVRGGYKQSVITLDSIQNVRICWLTRDNMPMVELLAPIDENSPVCKILEKNGVSPYHVGYEVENIDDALKELRSMKYVIVKRPEFATAINNCRVCFLYHKNVGLIELIESPAQITV